MSQASPPLRENPIESLFASPAVRRSRAISKLLDRGAAWLIGVGGLGVIAAVLLIAFYLVYEVVPLFERAKITPGHEYSLPLAEAGASLYIATGEQGETGFRLSRSGVAIFFTVDDGEVLAAETLPIPSGVHIASFALDSESSGLMALGLSDGSALLLRHSYIVSYADGEKLIAPRIEFPYGRHSIPLFEHRAVTTVGIGESESSALLVGQSGTETRSLSIQKSNKGDATLFNKGDATLFSNKGDATLFNKGNKRVASPLLGMPPARKILISPDLRRLFLLDKNGALVVVDRFAEGGVAISMPGHTRAISDIAWLLGGQSLISVDSGGIATQWFFVREAGAAGDVDRLVPVRSFETSGGSLQQLAVEQRRKGFITLDAGGSASLFHATATRRLLTRQLTDHSVVTMNLAPRADLLLLETADGRLATWQIENEHPEISLSALWGKVWYEAYPEPDYVWQSTAANNDFEPKLSVMPLAFGTLKAAFYAMLVAAPLALCAAIFTAYFMAPAMRARVKPLIELMEALPTVILGFLAGLWLAPFMEGHMIGVISLLLALPLATLLAALIWHKLPMPLVARIPYGWQAAILLPVVLLTAWLCFRTAPIIERAIFGGDVLAWMTQDLGVGFDQRNALVVGIAMGFAVIPTVFSIAEDAIFSVPRHLTMGSLALGARPWQTLTGVVLPTASPGIFSALMIGLGRAVGETMIVLMATGNTPIMDVNIFEGMRTMAANMAVEIPEAEVHSSHYRVLFLTAFVLFAFTFVVNAIAEIVRQRLRKKYGDL